MRAAALVLCALILAGCSSTKETAPKTDAGAGEEMRKFEESFNPSDHDPMRVRDTERHPRPVDTTSVPALEEATEAVSLEMVQGFRVQVFSSTSIDEARAKKEEFETLFPAEWFYLQYDTPTYKLRAGNFQNRFEAERFARELTGQGYRNAWTVPERVFKFPPKRTPPPVVPQEDPQ